ncbi:MAG: Crp/Fnr family transcriptional regulator [Hyphomicrobiaceae bacterium]
MDEAWKTAHADFLSSLSVSELEDLLHRASRVRLARRRHVFAAGDRSGAIYIVASGCIKLYQLTPGGREIILWFSFPGEIFGVAESIRGSVREISAEANAATELLVLEQDDFLAFLAKHPQAALRAIGILSARIRTLGSALVDIAADDVETRLTRLLLRFSAGSLPPPCALVRVSDEICVNIDLTRTDVAHLVGTTRQTATTLLARLHRDGLIRPVSRHLHIVDPARLRSRCESEGL